jgi:hypothetical protein
MNFTPSYQAIVSYSIFVSINNERTTPMTDKPPDQAIVQFGIFVSINDPKFLPIDYYSKIIYTYFFLIIGLFSNFISTIIFLRSHFRKNAMGIYLASFSIQSEVLLVTLWLSMYSPFKFERVSTWCKLFEILPSIMFQSTSLLIAAVSLDRYILVIHPLKFNFIKKLKFQIIVVFLILVFSISCCIIEVFFNDSVSANALQCQPNTNEFIYLVVLCIKDIVINYTGPITIMIITSFILLKEFFKLKRKFNKDRKLSKKDYNFAIASVISIIFFVLCCFPYMMNQIVVMYFLIKSKANKFNFDDEYSNSLGLTGTICNFFRVTYYSFSIIPHICFNVLFRSELVALIPFGRNSYINNLVLRV